MHDTPDDRHGFEAHIGDEHPVNHARPSEDRHLNVDQREIGEARARESEALLAVVCDPDVVPAVAHQVGEHARGISIVVDDKQISQAEAPIATEWSVGMGKRRRRANIPT